MVQAIALAETSAGVTGPVGDLDKPVGKRSYCDLQVQVGAARDVLRRWPRLWGAYHEGMADEEVIARLLTNRWFCVQAGARYYDMMLESFPDEASAVTAYNGGRDSVRKKRLNPKTHPYTRRVLGFRDALLASSG